MADIVYKYEEMRSAVEEIKGIATRYKTAATTLETNFNNAITGWEGASKDKMKLFISGPVMEYTRDTVPQLLESLASLLTANADQMEKADSQIAESIPTTLG